MAGINLGSGGGAVGCALDVSVIFFDRSLGAVGGGLGVNAIIFDGRGRAFEGTVGGAFTMIHSLTEVLEAIVLIDSQDMSPEAYKYRY